MKVHVSEIPPKNWLLLESGRCGYAFNMALDEALLQAMPRLQRPVLRFYGWTEKAASFGYFQRISDVERATALRPLVRRPTGGGIVPHDADWTYSIVFPATHEWHSLPALESYRRAHAWIQKAFASVGINTRLANAARKVGAGQCFAGHEKFDVLWRGQKIAGAAQRRTRDGLLIQGSVQPPSAAASRANWQRAMRDAGSWGSPVSWEEFTPDAKLTARADLLAREKYSQASHTRKR